MDYSHTVINLDNIRLDGGTQPRAQLDWTTIASYTEDMQNGDTFPPIVAYYDGADYWLVDGFHRAHAAQQAGLTEIPADVHQGTLQEAQWHSYGVNATHGLRRSNEDKRRAVEAALRHEYASRCSNREIARHCGVGSRTVDNYRREMEATAQIAQSDRRIGADGRTINIANIGKRSEPAHVYHPEPEPAQADIDTDESRWQAEEWDEPEPAHNEPEPVRYQAAPAQRETIQDTTTAQDEPGLADEPLTPYEGEAMDGHAPELPHTPEPSPIPEPPQDRLAVHYRSDTPEWYTPEHIIVKARQILGSIDLDPASSDTANKMMQAAEYYTEHNNGLALPWHGRVWMNPPYGDEIGKWTAKLLLEYEDGNITEALALLPARPDTAWFAPLFRYSRCWVRGRLRFVGADNSAPFPSVIVYLGERPGVFLEQFRELGHIDTPDTAFTTLWADYCRLREHIQEDV